MQTRECGAQDPKWPDDVIGCGDGGGKRKEVDVGLFRPDGAVPKISKFPRRTLDHSKMEQRP